MNDKFKIINIKDKFYLLKFISKLNHYITLIANTDYIYKFGLYYNQSNYCIVKKYIKYNNKYYRDRNNIIFAKYIIYKYNKYNNSCNKVSEWFDEISFNGLILGQSNYFIVSKYKKDSKNNYLYDKKNNLIYDKAIYGIINNKCIQISKYFKEVSYNYLVSGITDYYFAIDSNNNKLIFHKDDKFNNITNKQLIKKLKIY